jgi:hypothetical protein
MMRRSPIRCSKKRISHSWLISSKNDRMSASNIQLTFLLSIPTQSASSALEDKIVQRAVIALLNVIYEEDFLGISYGFRPGRSTHDAATASVPSRGAG